MCGIAGYIGREEMRDDLVLAALRHRGPDGEGVWKADQPDGSKLTLLHTRLKIIDLSEKAAQPMRLNTALRLQPAASTEESRYIAVYNGEIFNFREVREDLIARGHRFEGTGDTEVLVRGFAEWGPRLFPKLDGMFALAIHDVERRCLYLARDHAGIKPLYHARTRDGGICFASETRAILASGLLERNLNPAAILDYLETGGFREPATLYEGIRAFPAGHYAEIRLGEGLPVPLSFHRFWSVEESAEEVPGLSMAGWRELHRERLVASIRSQLASDVPLGVFLSGGIDSTLLLEQAVEAEGADRIRAFTLGGELTEQDEIAAARTTALRLGVRHDAVSVSGGERALWIREALDSLDLPSADGINLALVSRAARAQGLTVALSGMGADELHGDYGHPRRLARLMRLTPKHATGANLLRRAGAMVSSLSGAGGRAARIASMIDALESAEELVLEKRRYFGRAEILSMYPPARDPMLLGRSRRLVYNREALLALGLREQIRVADLAGYLRNTLLRDGDAVTMARGLEMRVPYLGRRYMECVLGAPEKFTGSGSAPKSRLVELLSPEGRAAAARPKVGFNIDTGHLLAGSMRPAFMEAVERLNSCANFNLDGSALLASMSSGNDRRRARRLWALLSLGICLGRG
ncbi:MAG: asparagine synthase (glutamine-hydrolyzing) [Opitutaceae bacterium]|nr:asparagine synthase (glutamine-hydrolyzing) [Opitutaceae bacterium]